MSEEEKHLMIFKSLFQAIKQGNFIMPLTHTSVVPILIRQLTSYSCEKAVGKQHIYTILLLDVIYIVEESYRVGNYDIFLSKPTVPRSQTV